MTVAKQSSTNQELKAEKQRALLDFWLPHLREFREIDLIWIEGSLVEPERENPGSDIDIRFAIKDEAYDELWDSNRHKIFESLGDCYPLAPFRIVTEVGVLIEFDAYRTSEVLNLELYEWEFLLNRLPDGQPNFRSSLTTGSSKWPYPQETNEQFVLVHTQEVLRTLSIAATPFYKPTSHAALFALDLLKMNLAHFLYWRAGVKPFRRFKHIHSIFTPELLADYEYVQFKGGEYSLDLGVIARATLKTFEMLIKYLKEMHKDIDKEFPERWLNILYKKLEVELEPFIEGH